METRATYQSPADPTLLQSDHHGYDHDNVYDHDRGDLGIPSMTILQHDYTVFVFEHLSLYCLV